MRTFVVFGRGGVGKTTASAALAVGLARRGQRTLVATVDPARRLADALGVQPSTEVQPVAGEPNLACYMPETGTTTEQVADMLFGATSEQRDRLRGNAVFRMLADGLAGVHELASLASLSHRADDFDALVIDTAPSKHALELLTLPDRLDNLVSGRAIRWLGGLGRRRAGTGRLRGALEWGKRRFVAGFERVLGRTIVSDALDVLAAALAVQPELAEVVTTSRNLLTGAEARHFIVLAPTADADADAAGARLFVDRITSAARPPAAFVLNRAPDVVPAWAAALAGNQHASDALRDDARRAHRELASAVAQGDAAERGLAAAYPYIPRIRIPALDAGAPADVVRQASAYLSPLLDRDGPAPRRRPAPAPLARAAATDAV